MKRETIAALVRALEAAGPVRDSAIAALTAEFGAPAAIPTALDEVERRRQYERDRKRARRDMSRSVPANVPVVPACPDSVPGNVPGPLSCSPSEKNPENTAHLEPVSLIARTGSTANVPVVPVVPGNVPGTGTGTLSRPGRLGGDLVISSSREETETRRRHLADVALSLRAQSEVARLAAWSAKEGA